jgi:hypothetical protein
VYAWDMCSWKRLLYPLDADSVESLGIPSDSVYEDMSVVSVLVLVSVLCEGVESHVFKYPPSLVSQNRRWRGRVMFELRFCHTSLVPSSAGFECWRLAVITELHRADRRVTQTQPPNERNQGSRKRGIILAYAGK